MNELHNYDRYDNKARAAAGKSHLGRPPYGYEWNKGILEPVFGQSYVVVLIFEMLDSGVDLHSVAAALNLSRISSPGGRAWSHTAVARIRDRRAFYEGRCAIANGGMYWLEKPIHTPIMETRNP